MLHLSSSYQPLLIQYMLHTNILGWSTKLRCPLALAMSALFWWLLHISLCLLPCLWNELQQWFSAWLPGPTWGSQDKWEGWRNYTQEKIKTSLLHKITFKSFSHIFALLHVKCWRAGLLHLKSCNFIYSGVYGPHWHKGMYQAVTIQTIFARRIILLLV